MREGRGVYRVWWGNLEERDFGGETLRKETTGETQA